MLSPRSSCSSCPHVAPTLVTKPPKLAIVCLLPESPKHQSIDMDAVSKSALYQPSTDPAIPFAGTL